MILCGGVALIDMLPRPMADGTRAFAPLSGGDVFNTAIALGRLGAPTALFTGLSRDLFGTQLEAALTASDVGTGLLARSDRPTTLAFVELVDGQARYAFYDENTAARMLTADDLPPLGPEIEAVFVGGISLAAEPCGTAFEALIQRASADRVTMFDPNIRMGVIKDEAAYRARLDRMLGMADVVKLSDEDLHWLMGADDVEGHAGALIVKGVKLVCITEGARGARAFTAAHALHRAAERVTPVDTVGAGDTFNAGLLAALHGDGLLAKDALAQITPDQITAALDLAVRAAAVTVSREGADPPRLAELSRTA